MSQAARLQQWVDRPDLFVRECIQAVPDSWQERELREFPKHERIAIAGSKGCAKTAFESWIVWWALATQPGANIGCVSTSGDNLRDGLWKELALWQSKSQLLQDLFHWSPERIVFKEEPGTWFASARRYRKDADPNLQAQSLAGLHGKRVMFVIDEAGGVPVAVLNTVDNVLATKKPGHQARVLIGGNTTSPSGALYHAMMRQRQLWHIVRITSDPKDPHRTPRVPVKFAEDQIAAYGRDNPWVRINIFAEFPEVAVGKLISLTEMEQAQGRSVEEDSTLPLVIGVDVGLVTAATVLYPRRGRLLYPPVVLRGMSTIVIAGKITAMAHELGATAIFVDVGGPGIGVSDQLRALGTNHVPVWFGGAADDSGRFANKRVEMYVRLAEWCKSGGAVDQSPELVQDICEPEVSWNERGQQIMEPKDDIVERLSRPPDWGDAAALTFAYPVTASREPQPVHHKEIAELKRGQKWSRPTQHHDEFGFGDGSR